MAVFEIVLIAVACVILGAAIGYFFGKHGTKQARQTETLQQQLAENEKALKVYKEEVTNYFQESAELVSNLTEAYRHVHNHIAEGANKLTPATLEGPILKNLPDQDTLDSLMPPSALSDEIMPPLDYAPKTSANRPGMLDESYGIEPEKQDDTENLSKAS